MAYFLGNKQAEYRFKLSNLKHIPEAYHHKSLPHSRVRATVTSQKKWILRNIVFYLQMQKCGQNKSYVNKTNLSIKKCLFYFSVNLSSFLVFQQDGSNLHPRNPTEFTGNNRIQITQMVESICFPARRTAGWSKRHHSRSGTLTNSQTEIWQGL